MRIAFAAFLVAGFATPALAQKAGQEIDVGGWTISDTREADGSFASCVASFTWDDKSTFAVIKAKDKSTGIIVSEPTAGLTKEKVYPVSLQVDSGKAVLGMGVAVTEQALIVPLEQPDPMLAQLAAGNMLTIAVAGKEHEEPLQGSANAIKALSACAARGLAG